MSARDVIANLRGLAARTSDVHGAQRVAWGPVWRDARRWLSDVLADDGLSVDTDAAGNNWITLPGQRPETVIIEEDTPESDLEVTIEAFPKLIDKTITLVSIPRAAWL